MVAASHKPDHINVILPLKLLFDNMLTIIIIPQPFKLQSKLHLNFQLTLKTLSFHFETLPHA